jgi:hypothetical protein
MNLFQLRLGLRTYIPVYGEAVVTLELFGSGKECWILRIV